MANEGAEVHEFKYDVFLCFRSTDTGRTFARNLYNALRLRRINTFFLHPDPDPDPPLNDLNDTIIPKAIQQSRISIVIFSENFASSISCLDELVNIFHCWQINNQLVWPIFYHVHATQVRSHTRFEDAMSLVAEKFEIKDERIQQWREALSQVTNISGWSFDGYGTGYEHELIKKVVDSAVQSLPRYDVFLSFSGEDTRYSFTGFLYNALRREGFKAYMDDEGLVTGNEIGQALLTAIEKSRLSIVVFSENFGYSTWCLDELAKIVECMRTRNQLVWPVFYKVEQSDVSNLTKSYGAAIAAHEERFGKGSEMVQKWRSALSQVANMEGEHLKENEYEYEFIQRIVKRAIDFENR